MKQQKTALFYLLPGFFWLDKFTLINTWQAVKDSSHSTKIALAVKNSRGASIKGVVKDWKKKYLLQSVCNEYL